MKQHTHLLLASLLVSLLTGLTAIAHETPGGRTGRFIFDTRYIADTGSYLTNDTCHVALTKTANIIPDDTEVLVYARPVVLTNASDWVQLLPLRTIAEHPADYYLANAISNDVMVTANYVPPSPVITNFLFTTACKICLGITPTTSLPLIVPHAKAIAVDSFDSRVEYLESTGTQHIDTGLIAASGWKIDITFSSASWSSGDNAMSLFGARTSYSSQDAFSAFTSASGLFPQYDGEQTVVNNTATELGRIYRLVMSEEGAFLDGVQIRTSNARTFTTPCSFYLFKKNQQDNGADRPFKGRIYSVKLWNAQDVLVFDGQPVRVGNIGYMFDAVSGKLFGNAGTGNFILGPDL